MATERGALDQTAAADGARVPADGHTAASAVAVADPPNPSGQATPAGTRPSGAAGTGGTGWSAPTTAAAAPPTPRRRLPRRIVVPILIVALVVAVVIAYRYWQNATLYVSTDNSQVSGALIQVGSVNAGRISSIGVDVGSAVRRDQQVATVSLPSTLTVTDAGTPRLGFRGTEDLQAPVTAPVDGVVVQRLGNPGDTVAPGQAIVTVVDPTQLWILAQIEETKVTRVHVGQRADVHVDTIGKTLVGRVIAVDRSTAGSFSLIPQTTTSGNFTKVTQLVPVKIAIDYGKEQLVLGSSVEVKIHIQD